MKNPSLSTAISITSIGMFLLFLLAPPLQALSMQTIMRQRLAPSQTLFSFQIASAVPPIMLARSFSQSNMPRNRVTPSVITLSLQAEPASRQDFRFHGDFGDFRLDSAEPDDGDAITQTATFTVTPGVYTVTADIPLTWHLEQIDCTPDTQVQIDQMTGRAIFTVQEGDQLHCTFVNQRGATIRTRSYHDRDGDRYYSLGELPLSDWKMTVYKDQNIVMGAQMTNQYGKANFNYLPAGAYAVCEAGRQGWDNSQPGLTDPTYGGACYTFTLQSGELATLWFGNQQLSDPDPTTEPPLPRAVAVVQGADVATDDSGYDDWEFVDADMTQDERAPAVFLPLTFSN